MNKAIVPPVVIVAAATVSAFYTLYFFAQIGYSIPSFSFPALTLTAAALLSLGIVPVISTLKRRQKIEFRHHHLRPMPCVILCILSGIAIGSYAELALRKERRPPRTLTALTAVRTVIVELAGEPIPAGHDYYRVPVRLIACGTANGAQFSAAGAIQLRFPAALVRGTYAGGITRINDRIKLEKFPFFLRKPLFAEALRTPQICRFYTRGMRLLAQGNFDKTHALFYVKPIQPLFLGWASPLSRLRAFFRFAFMRLLYDWGDAGGLLLALLAADKAFLPQKCIQAFRNAGLAHILALSGMHLSLIGAAALQGGKIFGHNRRAMQFSLAAVCIFVWFAGSAPSLNRALGMVFITAFGKSLGLKPPPLSVLCAMLTLHIAVCSADAVTLGFMLSYGACAGIIIFGDAVSRLIAGKIPPDIAQSISASVGAQLFTAPIVITSIGSIASAGVIASCITGPLVSLFLIAGLAGIPLAFAFPPLSSLLGLCLHFLYHIIFSITDFFARFPLIVPETGIQRIIFSVAVFSSGLLLIAAASFRNQQPRRKRRGTVLNVSHCVFYKVVAVGFNTLCYDASVAEDGGY